MRRVWLEPRWRPCDAVGRPALPLEALFGRERLVAAFGRCRDAFWWIARGLSGARWTCWLPAYGCHQMAAPFERALHDVQYYDVDEDGNPNWSTIPTEIDAAGSAPRLLLVADTFGYPPVVSHDTRDRISRAFDIVVRDAAHSLPGAVPEPIPGRCGTYSVYSFRKALGTADGAFVTVPSRQDGIREDTPTHGCVTSHRNTLYLAIEWIGRGVPPFRAAAPYRWSRVALREQRLGVPMSRLDRCFVRRLDIHAATERRRRNATRLAEALPVPTLRHDHEVASPLYFPIRTRNAADAANVLQRHGVESFAAWTLDHVPDVARRFPMSQRLANTIVGLPVHQDLINADVSQIASAVQALRREHLA